MHFLTYFVSFILQDTSASASSASVGASAGSGFIDQYFGGEFETMYPFSSYIYSLETSY